MIKRPMKGPPIEDLSLITFPKLVSAKIDGFRCVLGHEPMTSRLSPFPNRAFMAEASGLLPRHGPLLDGEVVVGKHRGKGVLGRTSSGLTSTDGHPDWTLWVFDAPLVQRGFEERLRYARGMVEHLDNDRIHVLKHTLVESINDLEAYIAKKLDRGFEGIILRDPLGLYKEGKSTPRQQWMLKFKPFIDAEGRITGWFEEQQNNNEAKREVTGKLKRSSAKAGKVGKGRLGGFILEDCETGVEVRVGGGFSQEQRIELWKIIQRDPELLRLKLVRYKKQKIGEKDKPRHPNFVDFVDFRPEWDFTE
jgi:DNA ligase-1